MFASRKRFSRHTTTITRAADRQSSRIAPLEERSTRARSASHLFESLEPRRLLSAAVGPDLNDQLSEASELPLNTGIQQPLTGVVAARIWSARPWLGILTCLLAATLAAPAARATTMYVSSVPQSIFQVSASGVISPFATFPVGSHPYGGLAFDSSGNLFVADSLTSQISKITPGGAVSRFATVPNDGVASGLAIDRSGNLYVRDVKSDPVKPNIEQIDKITPAGMVTHFAVLPGSSSRGLAFDGSGNLYVADSLSDQINKITSAGVVSPFATVPRGSFPIGLAFDGNGNLYAADHLSDQISKITPGGVVSLFASLPGSNPYGLAFDGGGNLYYASSYPGQIGRISPDGLTVSTFATGLTDPSFIAFAPAPEPSSAVLLGIASGSIFLRRGLRHKVTKILTELGDRY